VAGPEILDHLCLQSYRNSVMVVPENLESVFAIMNLQEICGWSRNSGPSVFAVIQKFCDDFPEKFFSSFVLFRNTTT
jgi:hypothetical protein